MYVKLKLWRENMQEVIKAVFIGKFIALNSYVRNEEKLQINNLSSHLITLEKTSIINPN